MNIDVVYSMYGSQHILNIIIGLVGRVFANDQWDQGSISGRVIPT